MIDNANIRESYRKVIIGNKFTRIASKNEVFYGIVPNNATLFTVSIGDSIFNLYVNKKKGGLFR